MKVYQPQISVLLIKSERRTEVAPGIPAIQERYGKLDSIDITPYLDDQSSVQVSKSTRQPGTFSIRFSDQKHVGLMETIYALICPMDIIEIRMAHDVSILNGKPLPIVMRGFVSSISRNEGMTGNYPQRSVNVSGHDFMKVLQIYRINYRIFTDMVNFSMADFAFFQAFIPDSGVKNMSGNEFTESCVDNIVNPYMSDIAALTRVGVNGDVAVNQWRVNSSIDGTVSAQAVNSFTDESLYNIMRTVLDVGVWNEMFIEETEEAPILTVRPIPFKNAAGSYLQGTALSLAIASIDIVNQSLSRSDESVANYYWVSANRLSLMSNNDQRSAATTGGTESFVKFDYINSKKSVFGFRMLDVETVMGSNEQTDADIQKEKTKSQNDSFLLSWQEQRRKLLADMNCDNVVFETGSMTVRGNEAIKAGMYINVLRGIPAYPNMSVYAHSVTHVFQPFVGFTTMIQFDRGTGFVDRAQSSKSTYIQEIEGQGTI